MSDKMNLYNPDYAIHPGEYLEEILEARNIKKSDLAKRCGRSEKQISQIIGRHNNISSATALAFEKALGISADIWNNMNANYQLFQAREKEKADIKKDKEWINKFPVKELKKMGHLPGTKDIFELNNALLHFFGISNQDTWNHYYLKKTVNYRKSTAFTEDCYAVMTWLRMGELKAEEVETENFNKHDFETSLKEIRKLTKEEPVQFIPKMIKLCAESGIAFVLVPEIKGIHISGAAEWLNDKKAAVIMSLRYKTNDHFWFSFYHEAAHILLHGKKNLFIDIDNQVHKELEKEADAFARDHLIPSQFYTQFIKKNNIYESDIIDFARKLNIAPGIVVGRLQHDKKIKYSWLNKLKTPVSFAQLNRE